MLLAALLFGLVVSQDPPPPPTTLPDMVAIGGRVTLECVVRSNGRLTDCRVIEENPAGYGFGEAALNAARETRVSPRSGGSGADGARIRWTTRFQPMEDAAPAEAADDDGSAPAPANP